MLKHIHELSKLPKALKRPKKLVLAVAQDSYALSAVKTAAERGFIEPVLVGNRKMIGEIGAEKDFDLSRFEIVHEEDPKVAVDISVGMVRRGDASILMKGACGTAMLLKGVLNREIGLRNAELLSHFALFEIPGYHKLLGITDVAINIAPDTEAKLQILRNAAGFLNRLGLTTPKVAVIAAVETVNEQMQATVDADLLTRMNREGRISNCLVHGPLAFDNAVSRESAEHKNIVSEVAGDADLLLMPGIESGNVLYKALTFFTRSKVASVILGASAPVVLTSRSDSEESKLNSILLAAAVNVG
jgi:phosphate butyryltransferase